MFLIDIRLDRQMCDKAIVENGGTLEFVPDRHKNQQLCY